MSKATTAKSEVSISMVLITIVTLLCIAFGVTTLVRNCYKVAQVGANLIVLNDDAQFYNEQTHKTDKMTDNFNQELSERNKFYQSEDTVTRVFSNLPTVPKLCIWILAIACIPAIPCLAILGTVRYLQLERSFQKHEARGKQKQLKRNSGL